MKVQRNVRMVKTKCQNCDKMFEFERVFGTNVGGRRANGGLTWVYLSALWQWLLRNGITNILLIWIQTEHLQRQYKDHTVTNGESQRFFFKATSFWAGLQRFLNSATNQVCDLPSCKRKMSRGTRREISRTVLWARSCKKKKERWSLKRNVAAGEQMWEWSRRSEHDCSIETES